MEYAHITFDLDADLTSLFTWNTKQLFVWISASYPSTTPGVPASEVIIWDAIIPADDAPWHQNTYIHPSAKSSAAASAGNKKKRVPAKKSTKPYPPGTSPGILRLTSQKPKYQITDISGKIASRENATLSLHWNTQPYVGLLTWQRRRSASKSPDSDDVEGGGQQRSRGFLRWAGLKGGQSQTFSFPGLAGSGGTETVKAAKEELETAKGQEGHRLETGQAQQAERERARKRV